jgi:hypothetical protein
MAKLTSQQRDHFKGRIDDRFTDMLGPLEKIAAFKKAELVEEKYDEFVKNLGLESTLQELSVIEEKMTELKQRLSNHMSNLIEQYDMPTSNYGTSKYVWEWSGYSTKMEQIETALRIMCRKECEIAFKSIPEGAEIERLKTKKMEAIDYIMGYDQQKELLDGLANLLEGSGVAMLTEYKETK